MCCIEDLFVAWMTPTAMYVVCCVNVSLLVVVRNRMSQSSSDRPSGIFYEAERGEDQLSKLELRVS